MSNTNENYCPKCKLSDMKPNYMGEGQRCNYVNNPVDKLIMFTEDNPLTWNTKIVIECIIWGCPECKYRIAKKID